MSEKEVKKILKREKKNKRVIIREDQIEDPMGGRGQATRKSDHYLRDEQNFRVDLQKELLCTGNTFRVLNKSINFYSVFS